MLTPIKLHGLHDSYPVSTYKFSQSYYSAFTNIRCIFLLLIDNKVLYC